MAETFICNICSKQYLMRNVASHQISCARKLREKLQRQANRLQRQQQQRINRQQRVQATRSNENNNNSTPTNLSSSGNWMDKVDVFKKKIQDIALPERILKDRT
jgi:hypothetical protein